MQQRMSPPNGLSCPDDSLQSRTRKYHARPNENIALGERACLCWAPRTCLPVDVRLKCQCQMELVIGQRRIRASASEAPVSVPYCMA